MGFLAQLIGEIVTNLFGEFLRFWTTKQLGKKEQALADSEAGRALDQQAMDARDAQPHPVVTDDWLRHSGTPSPANPAGPHTTLSLRSNVFNT